MLSGYDPRDPHCAPVAVPDYLAACDRDPRPLRIAWSPSFGYAAPDAEVRDIADAAARTFAGLGCTVEEVHAPLGPDPAAMWTAEFYAGVAARLAPSLRERRELLDPDVAETVEQALTMGAEAYGRAVQMRYAFRETARQFFERYDLLLSPTLPIAGVEAGVSIPPGFTDRNLVTWVSYTYPFNLTGQPAASIPGGFTRAGLPVGVQLVARAFTRTTSLPPPLASRRRSHGRSTGPVCDCGRKGRRLREIKNNARRTRVARSRVIRAFDRQRGLVDRLCIVNTFVAASPPRTGGVGLPRCSSRRTR